MDCEKLSPNALKIFEKITAYYPPYPWKRPRWTPNGMVHDNGWHDLRKKEDRDKLIRRWEHTIGATVVMFANQRNNRKKKLTRSVFNFKMSRRWIELAVLLKELDFQIETMDLVE